MADYRPYLDKKFLPEFDDFLIQWEKFGSRNFDPPALRARLDPEYVADWETTMVDTGRIDGYPDAERRLKEVEKEGICAEVLFPDFGMPFELYSVSLAAAMGYALPDEEHRQAAYRAFNRWLVDYMSVAPERFVGNAIVSWHDINEAIADIKAAYASGLKGIVLPEFSAEMPLYHSDYEPVWKTIEELGMLVHSHPGLSSTSNRPIFTPGVPHPALSIRVWLPEAFFFTHNILNHLIWGGVLERHPDIKFIFTEQGLSLIHI